jgi:hypothetical protein
LKFPTDIRSGSCCVNKKIRRWVFVVVCVLLCPSQSVLGGSVHEQPTTVVEELLQLDTHAALLAARKKVVGPLNMPGPATRLITENILLAIYGVGTTLTAEVLLDSEPHVFKSSRSQAVSGRNVAYTLERIEPPCIYLKKEMATHRLCLGQVRP